MFKNLLATALLIVLVKSEISNSANCEFDDPNDSHLFKSKTCYKFCTGNPGSYTCTQELATNRIMTTCTVFTEKEGGAEHRYCMYAEGNAELEGHLKVFYKEGYRKYANANSDLTVESNWKNVPESKALVLLI